MREASATQAPPIPQRIGAIAAQKLVEELGSSFTLDGRYLGADVGDGPPWEDIVDRRRRIDLAAGGQPGEDYAG